MAKKRKFRSDAFAAAHDAASAMHSVGAISDAEMSEYDAICKVPIDSYDAGKVQELRRRYDLEQWRLAYALNLSLSTIRQWEQGKKKPSAAAQKLLFLLDTKGLDAIL